MIHPSSFFFTHSVTVQRPFWALDRAGAPTPTGWNEVAGCVNLPCSVQPADARTVMIWAQRNINVTHEVYVASPVGLREGDRLIATHPQAGASETLLVTGWYDEVFQGRVFVIGCVRNEP